MTKFLAVVFICFAADDCDIYYSADQPAAFPSHDECIQYLGGMLQTLQFALNEREIYVLKTACLELPAGL